MIPQIKKLQTLENFKLLVVFDDDYQVIYDVLDDIKNIPCFQTLLKNPVLFGQVQLDESRTCVFWNDCIDLSSDSIYEYGLKV